MSEILPTSILVLGIVAAMSLLAQRLAVPEPVLLAVAGMLWSLAPALPRLEIHPHLILGFLLPPLLYAEAWEASWIDFRRWLRSILQLAIGLVAFTIAVVGLVAHQAMPALPLAACFLLGAIVSPTDTVAVQAVLERLRIPRRVTAVLGGESLVNDATGLLGVGLATAVLLTGEFEVQAIGVRFLWITGLGVAIGIAVGLGAAAINRRVRGTNALFALSLLAPYLTYWLAEHAGSSGVLAVVIAGFVASWRVHYIAAESRVDLYTSWDRVAFLFNAVMFLYVGLEAPGRLQRAIADVPGIVGIALLIALSVIAARIAWMYPSAYLPPWLLRRMREREGGYPDVRGVTLGAWSGARGAVSLAAALALPLTLADGVTPFPGRDEIIACTLVVILVTLIGQGVTLLPLVRLLGLSDADPTESEVRHARQTMLSAGIARLDAFCSESSCPIAVYRLREAMTDQLAALESEDAVARSAALQRLEVAVHVRDAVYEAQGHTLLALRDRGMLNDRAHQELQIDLDREHASHA